ncbi:uncharacterized protein LOC106063030 [Biomphalaria glabrata]|uniref:Uncharacterized protein LOC106063030 n=1 Tax=Biomphalaria glabrata TaxID=6526 RepID=A0A9U8E881_BIOGL|nr:uncharacterized protein LOC106063030 [Biomphalaria glabrata]
MLTSVSVLAVSVICCVSAGVIQPTQPSTKDDDTPNHDARNRRLNVTLCDDGHSTEVYLGNQTTVTVRSPNYGDGEYPDNARCMVVFRTGDQAMMVLLQFNSFDLEMALDFGSCDYDWLCVNGVKFCGDWASRRVFEYLVPAHKTFTLYFSTDVAITKTGFEAVLEAYHASNKTVTIPTSGSGSSEKQITYITTALSRDFTENYKDKCNRSGYYSIFLPDATSMPPSTRLPSSRTTRRY